VNCEAREDALGCRRGYMDNAQIFNKKSNKDFRRKLRKLPIRAERELWCQIRNRRIGYKFRRQFGIGKYIVDFYCPELRFVIEVDGATHTEDKEIEYDSKRQKYIESLGLKVVRIRNVDIMERLEAVVEKIIRECNKLV
jgi:very-short-patch-repair endonuclease